MSPEKLRDRIRDLSQVHWHYTLRLLPDVVVNGAKSTDTLAAGRAANLGVVDLANLSVVDVGTWDGYFASESSRVIATDSYVWRCELFRGRETFELARECLGIDVEAKQIDPTEFPGELWRTCRSTLIAVGSTRCRGNCSHSVAMSCPTSARMSYGPSSVAHSHPGRSSRRCCGTRA